MSPPVGIRPSKMFTDLDLDETAGGIQIKAERGILRWIHCINLHIAPIYLKIFDQTTVVVGTTVPNLTLAVPSQGDANGAGFTLELNSEFNTGLNVACTLNAAVADATSPGASVCIFNCGYE